MEISKSFFFVPGSWREMLILSPVLYYSLMISICMLVLQRGNACASTGELKPPNPDLS